MCLLLLLLLLFWLCWVFVAAQACFSCSEQGLLFVAVYRLLIAVASLFCRAWALGHVASGDKRAQ